MLRRASAGLVCLAIGIYLSLCAARAVAPALPNAAGYRIPSRSRHIWDYDGSHLLGPVDNDVLLWDATTGRLLQRLVGHSERIFSAHLQSGGKRALTSSWAPPGETEYLSKDTSVRLWDLASGKQLLHLGSQVDGKFSPNGKSILAFSERSPAGPFDAAIWDASTGRRLVTARLDPFASPEYDELSFSPGGREFLYFGATKLMLFDAANGREIGQISRSPIDTFQFYGQEGRIATFGSGGIETWDLRSRQPVRHISVEHPEYWSTSWRQDGRGVIGIYTYPSRLASWEVVSGKETDRPWSGKYLQNLIVSPDNQRFAVGSGGVNGLQGEVGLYDLKTCREITHFVGEALYGFSPDGKTLLLGGSQFVICNSATGEAMRRFNLEDH